jgi:hypothetical protein
VFFNFFNVTEYNGGGASLTILSYMSNDFTLRQFSTISGELGRIRAAAATATPAIFTGV